MGIDNFKKKLLSMDKDRKTSSRLAMKFGFEVGKALENVDFTQTQFINDENKANTDERHVRHVDDDKHLKQNENYDINLALDFNLDSHVSNSFLIVPFFRTEDYLVGQKSSSYFSPNSRVDGSSRPFAPLLSSVSRTNVSLNSDVIGVVESDISLPSALSDSLKRQPTNQTKSFKETDRELESYSEFLSEFDSLGEDYKTIVEYLGEDDGNHRADQKRVLSLEDVSIYVTPRSHCSFQSKMINDDRYNGTKTGAEKIRSREEIFVKLDTADETGQRFCIGGNECLNDDENEVTEDGTSLVGDSSIQDVSREETEVELMKVLEDNLNSEDDCMSRTDDDGTNNSRLYCHDNPSEKETIFSSMHRDNSSIMTSESISMDNRIYSCKNKFEQGCQTENSLEFYPPATIFSPVGTSTQKLHAFKHVKSSVDRSIQTDDDFFLQSSKSPSSSIFPEKPRKSSQASQTEIPKVEFNQNNYDNKETASDQASDEFKNNRRFEEIRECLKRIDSPCRDEIMSRGHGGSSRASMHSLNSTLSMAEEASSPLVEMKFESANDFNRWRLMQLAELERKKQEIMNMNERDMELLKLRKDEKDLKNQLRKIIRRRKELEEQKVSTTSGDSSSFVDLCNVGKSYVANDSSNLVCSFLEGPSEPVDQPIVKYSDDTAELIPRNSLLIGDCISGSSANDLPNAVVGSDNSLSYSKPIIDVTSSFQSSSSSTLHHKCAVTGPREQAAFDVLCSKLAPIVRGYIVRRLFHCQKVKEIIKTLIDVSKEILVIMPIVYSNAGDRKDNLLLEGLRRQLTSASSRLIEIFRSPTDELLKVIADQRLTDRIDNFKDQKPHKRQLSLATRKTIERKETAHKSASSSCVSLKSGQLQAMPPSSIVQSSSKTQLQKNRSSNVARMSRPVTSQPITRSVLDKNVKVGVSSQNSKIIRAAPNTSNSSKSLRCQPTSQQRINPQATKPHIVHLFRQ